MTSYAEKLKDPRWQRRRLEKLSSTEFLCEGCFEDGKTVHVHHRIYRRGADPWDYPDGELAVLCEECHEIEHLEEELVKEAIAVVPHSLWSGRSMRSMMIGYCYGSFLFGNRVPDEFRADRVKSFYVDLIRRLSESGERDGYFLAGFMAAQGFPDLSSKAAADAGMVVLP
jgi:hypothetical protein